MIFFSHTAWQAIARNLREQAGKYNFTVNTENEFKEPYAPDFDPTMFPDIIEETHKRTRSEKNEWRWRNSDL